MSARNEPDLPANEEFLQRVLRYQEKSLSQEELHELNEELRDNPERLAEFTRLCKTSRMIHEAAVLPSRHAQGGLAEKAWPWLFGGVFWKVAAAIVVLAAAGLGVKSVGVYTEAASPAEVFVYGQERFLPGATTAVRVFVRNAARQQPIRNAVVTVALVGPDARRIPFGVVTTGPDGMAFAEATLPADLAEGDYSLEVVSESPEGQAEVTRDVAVLRSFRTMLSTDKPLYQPGQVMHMRALSLASDRLVPAAGRTVAFEVRDPKGNMVFREREPTSDFGIAAADFQLADQVNLGDYTIAVTVGDTTSERTVTVERYVLPRYRIDLKPDRPWYRPGETVKLTVDANYTFGKPVSDASVTIVAEEFVERFREFARVEGVTGKDGSFEIPLPLKDAFVGQELNKGDAFARLTAEVTDAAGETRKKSLQVKVSKRPIRIDAFPESGELVQGVENILYLVCAYPDGTPAEVKLELAGSGGPELETSDLGIAQVKITPRKKALKLTVTARDPSGLRATAVIPLRVGEQPAGLLLRSDRAVYAQGDSARLSVFSSTPARRVFVDVVKNSRSALTSSLELDGGAGELVLDLPADLAGTLTLQAYAILEDGNLVRDTKLIQVHRAEALTVSAKLDAASYRPAEKALLRFLVRDTGGEPVEAALSIAAVDEAVFALNDSRPGLEDMYFLIQEEMRKPRYQLTAVPPARFTELPPEPQPELEEANVILFSAAEGAEATPMVDRGETFEQREREVAGDKREFGEGLARIVLLGPLVLFVLLFLGWMLHVCILLGRRSALVAGGPELREFRRRTSFLFWVFYLAILVPPFLLFGFAMTMRSIDEEVLLAGAALLLILFAIGLFGAAWEVRRARLTDRELPRMRRLGWVLAALYPLAVVAIVGIFFAMEEFGGDDDLLAPWILIVLASLPVAAASILSVRRSYTRPRGPVMNGLAFAGQVLLCPLPILLLGSVTLSGGITAAGAKADGMAPRMLMAEAPTHNLAEGTRRPGEAIAPSEAAGEAPRVRSFFPETLLWQPQLVTDASGAAELEIELADSITTWRLSGSAVSREGELGAFQKGIRVFQDFFIDIDFPVELTQGDEVSVPVVLFNYLDRAQQIRLEATTASWFELVEDEPAKTLKIGAREVGKAAYRIRVLKPGRHSLTVTARGDALSDAVERSVRVVPDGLRVERTINGRLEDVRRETIVIPENAIDGGSDLFVKIYPGAFSQVVEGMDSIFRMPHGCFEQTSSTTYPNILVLDYLTATKQARPEIEMKALNFINVGYQRLISYEVQGGGFSWFGRAPAHPILTAYGLMEFVDMNRVHEVDEAIIRRTREWLLGLMAGNGSFDPELAGISEGAINAFQGRASAEDELRLRNTAYIAWAVAQAGGVREVSPALDFISRNRAKSDDPYTLALCANALTSGGREKQAGQILDRLAGLATGDGDLVFWGASGSGLMHSHGDSFAIETTALVVQALLGAKRDIGTAHKALAWIVSKKDPNGTWHSTQATVQAMRALLAGTNGAGRVEGEAAVTITANDGEATSRIQITGENAQVFHLVSLSEAVQTGENTVELGIEGEGSVAWQIVAVHHEPHALRQETPPLQEPLSIEVDYSATKLAENDTLTVGVTLRYRRLGPAPMTLVDLGIPPGFEVEADSLMKLVKDGVIQRFAHNGRQVTLYFDRIPGKGGPVEFSYTLRAKFPVKAKAPASVAYQYYEPEIRDETLPVLITVEAAGPDALVPAAE